MRCFRLAKGHGWRAIRLARSASPLGAGPGKKVMAREQSRHQKGTRMTRGIHVDGLYDTEVFAIVPYVHPMRPWGVPSLPPCRLIHAPGPASPRPSSDDKYKKQSLTSLTTRSVVLTTSPFSS